jgi:teichuronic acid biosynthesis glycosyltransferase TuaG
LGKLGTEEVELVEPQLNHFNNLSGADFPLISIIMPAFNASITIAESIESVLGQTYGHWELIIVDDGSKDDTYSLAKCFECKEKRIVVLSLPYNGGLPNARNQGCKIAKGAFIAFLDSDDLWHKDKLREQLDFHLQNPQIKISHTDFHVFNKDGLLKRPLRYLMDLRKHKEGSIYPRICYRNPIGVLTTMVDRELLRKAGFFDSSLWTMEDQDLWVRIAKMGNKFGYIPKVLAYYRIGLSSITSKTGKYKRAYKSYITKILRTQSVNRGILYAYYCRHFGTVYFKNGQYRLSRLYFCKSIKLAPTELIGISSGIYFLYAVAKSCIQNFDLKKR